MPFAIACGHEITAQAAEDVLRAGGNAIDAAIAAFTTSWITEPCMSGPGGGAFAVIHLDGKHYALDCFAKTPRVKRATSEIQFIPVTIDFGGTQEVFYTGQGSCAIPGAVDGVFALHQLGATMPVRELLQPAMHHAREGVAINEFQHYDLNLLRKIVIQGERGKQLFFPGDQLVDVGTVVAMPHLSDFLDFLSREGRDAFYQGEVARRITDAASNNGGHITMEDLQFYEPQWSAPMTHQIRDSKILTHGAPSMGGIMLNSMLAELDRSDTGIRPLMEAIRDVQRMKDEGEFAIEISSAGGLKSGGTSHISIVDSEGNAVSLSMSIGEGSGCYVAGTDIHMNNMMGEEALMPSGPHSWKENARLASMMTPAIMLNQTKRSLAALGSGGAGRIPYMIAQVIYHHVMGGLPMAEAVAHPRLYFADDRWQAEPPLELPAGMPANAWNSWVKQSLYFGGVHCAGFSKGEYVAIGDARRYGAGVVS